MAWSVSSRSMGERLVSTCLRLGFETFGNGVGDVPRTLH